MFIWFISINPSNIHESYERVNRTIHSKLVMLEWKIIPIGCEAHATFLDPAWTAESREAAYFIHI
ncbi:hypothetical protein PAENIP36_62890 [Paenibacillus sp. P36]